MLLFKIREVCFRSRDERGKRPPVAKYVLDKLLPVVEADYKRVVGQSTP